MMTLVSEARRLPAVVGVGTTPVGRVPGSTPLTLTVDAATAALDDAGLTWKDLDGLYTTTSRVAAYDTGSAMLAEHIGLHPNFALSLPVGGMQFVAGFYHCASIIAAGIAETVMLVSADALLSSYGRSGSVDHYSDTGHPNHEIPFGTHIPSQYALIAQRHMYEYGTKREDLAAFAVQMRKNASQHPGAQMKDLITVDDVLQSRPISSPFNLLDCSLISDGGAAFILTSQERAAHLRKRPINLLGAGEGRAHQCISQSPSLASFAARISSRRAFEMAGLGPKDVDVALLYDAFTITPILSLEALGFCGPGEGGSFVAEGRIAPDAELPVNPHGGLLSYAHPGRPGAALHVAEAILQLRGEARGVQVVEPEVAVVQANAGILSGEMTLLFGRS